MMSVMVMMFSLAVIAGRANSGGQRGEE